MYLNIRINKIVLRMYPYLFYAWSIFVNLTSWNIKFPDGNAIYQVTLIEMLTADKIIIELDIPYSRYFSYQIYDYNFNSYGSIVDYNIYTDGLNCFNEICSNYSSYQGSTLIEFKKQGEINSNNGIIINSTSNYFVIVYRLYDIDVNIENDMMDGEKYFGWIEKPKIYKNYELVIDSENQFVINAMQTLPNVSSTISHSGKINSDNNFYKESNSNLAANDDSDYLISLINIYDNNPPSAIIYGKLPITANSIFESPRVGYINQNNANIDVNNEDYYEVRYISFSLGISSPPENTISTIMDKDIMAKYSHSEYKIYVGGSIEDLIKIGCDIENDLYFLYPKTLEGIYYEYVNIIYRNLLSQSKILGTNAIFKKSINDIVDNVASSIECENVMGEYYPKIDFVTLD